MKLGSSSILVPRGMFYFFEISNEAWSIKNTGLETVYGNNAYQHLMDNVADTESNPLSQFNLSERQHDKLVLQSGQRIEALGTLQCEYSKRFKTYIFEKMPIYGKKNCRQGIITHIKELDVVMPGYFINGVDYGKIIFSPPSALLSSKEWEVVFLLLLGMSSQEISNIIHRSTRTVKYHRENILRKTGSVNLEAFKKYALKLRWHFYIPPRFLTFGYVLKDS